MNSSKSLFTLTACALVAAAVPAFALNSATTEYNGTTYSGDIYKITNTASTSGLSGLTAEKYDSSTQTFSGTYGGEESYTHTNGTTQVSYNGWLANDGDSVYVGNTLLLTAATSASNSLSYTFDWGNYVWIGGLITEGDGSYTIGRSQTDKNTNIKLSGTKGVNMNIGADTTISAKAGTSSGYGTISIESSGNWVVASGKTLTLAAAHGVNIADGVSISVSGGGTVSVETLVVSNASGGAGKITFDGSTTGGVITLAQGESYSDYADFASAFSVSDGTTVSISSYGVNGVSTGFTGTVELKNISINGSSLALSNYGVAGSKIVIDGVTGTGGTGQGQGMWLAAETVAADIEFAGQGLTITNGGSTSTTTFSGKITGTGNFSYNGTSATNSFTFSGDLSEYQGSISSSATGGTLTFGNGKTGAANGSVSGKGAIDWKGSALVFNYASSGNALEVGNRSITAGTESKTTTVTFQGGADYLVNATLSASALTISAGTTTLAGATNTVTGAITVSADAALGLAVENVSAGSVTFAEGAKLVLDDALIASSDSTEEFVLALITSDSITFGETLLTTDNVSTFFADDTWVTFGAAFDGYDRAFSYDNNTLSLTLTAIPEPSAFGLLAGLGALALVASRRRRNKR